jgi:hypothetical protein
MSGAGGNRNGDGRSGGRRALDRAAAGRGRADLVSGLRGLARRPGGPGRGATASAGGEPTEKAGTPPGALADADEHCELCAAPLPPDHRHLLHLEERRMLCACETCWSTRSGEASFRPAGARTVWLDDFDLPDEAWASLRIPIGLAFFMRAGADDRVFAFYPSPAGATESEVDEAAWERLVGLNPELEGLEPDCEALVVNRMGESHEHVIAPIDECYRLVGMIKTAWEGISGGAGPERAIARFFAELRVRTAATMGPDG